MPGLVARPQQVFHRAGLRVARNGDEVKHTDIGGEQATGGDIFLFRLGVIACAARSHRFDATG